MKLPEKSKTCCFTGHRFFNQSAAKLLYSQLISKISSLCSQGITTFISGGALGFDTLAAEAVLELKRDNKQITLILVIPCRDQSAKWSAADKKRYEDILIAADEVVCLNEKYCTGCMHQRNRLMVELSSICLAYYTGKRGGTEHTVGLANENKLKVINLAYSGEAIK